MIQPFFFLLCVTAIFFCSLRMMASRNILSAALYLACISAITSAILYQLGATQVAVIELSVGAGLVTVLMVYAISVVGKDAADPKPILSRSLAAVACLAMTLILLQSTLPLDSIPESRIAQSLFMTMWQGRVLDVWIQVVLIFAGVMGILGLLSEQTYRSKPEPAPEHEKGK